MDVVTHWLLTDIYWIAAQGIIQNSTVVFWSAAVVAYYRATCKASPWCLRHAQHPVAGTAVKVCTKHHTLEDHERVFKEHDRTSDPNLLLHGESHDLAS